MCRKQIKQFFVGLFLAVALTAQAFAQSSSSIESSNNRDNSTLEAQASSLVALDAVTRAEQRVEALRARLLEIQTKEMELQDRLDELDYRLRPDRIELALVLIGSVRPMDERRDALRQKLENEKARVNKQLELLASSRERLEVAISEAERQVERLRQGLRTP